MAPARVRAGEEAQGLEVSSRDARPGRPPAQPEGEEAHGRERRSASAGTRHPEIESRAVAQLEEAADPAEQAFQLVEAGLEQLEVLRQFWSSRAGR